MEVQAGEIHGLLGHNGSGKSTLIKVLAGVVAPDRGRLTIAGTGASLPLTPASSRALGLRFVHQNLGLVPTLSVAENLLLERFTAHGAGPIHWRDLYRAATALLRRYGLDIDARAAVDRISATQQALVAIVRAVVPRIDEQDTRQRILVLDEPTVFLPRKQVADLFGLLGRLIDGGESVVLVSHRMDEVLAHADRVTVLRNGRNVITTSVRDTTEEELIEQIVGDVPPTAVPRGTPAAAAGVDIRVRVLSTPRLHHVDLDLRPGRVVGLTGLMGSGHDDLLYALFGCAPSASGTLTIGDRTVAIGTLTPNAAMRMGIGLIPGDRGRQAIASTMTIEENLTITDLRRYYRHGYLRSRQLLLDSRRAIRDFGIRPNTPTVRADQLSGGNQQRVVVAKWLRRRPRLLLLHEPTQGVDVGARVEIWSYLEEMARNGTTVLCATTDHDELTSHAAQVVIFASGRIARVLEGAEITTDRVAAETLSSAAWQQGAFG